MRHVADTGAAFGFADDVPARCAFDFQGGPAYPDHFVVEVHVASA